MSEEEELRRYAAECRSLAEGCKDAEEKRGWLNLAEAWLRKIRAQKNAEHVF